MMKLYVDKLLHSESLSDKERKDLIKYALSIKVGNFIKKYKLNLSPLELYIKIYEIKEIPKCKFCGNNRKFCSISKGFADTCGDNKCIRKNFLIKNNEIKNKNRIEYDNYLKDNLDFYRKVDIPFKDPYDNKIVKTHKQFCLKSASSLDILNESKKCIFCKSDYVFNKFKYDKCFCKSCYKGHNYRYLNAYEKFSEINFEIFKLNLKWKTFSNKRLLNLSRKYTNEQLYKLVTNNAIIYNGNYLERSASKDPYRYLYNNIITKDMYAICHSCGKKYIKYDKVIKDGKLSKVQIGANYSCSSKECYWKCIALYEYSEEAKIKQSNSLKEKIKNGEYTPYVTNSWTHSRKFELDNIKFRSSWEYLFYIINKSNNITLEYEKIRIPYYDIELNKNRIYIADFYDPKTKTVFEIKPNSLENNERNKEKFKNAEEYTKINGLKFKIINENFFKKCYNKNNILKYVPEKLKNHCLNLWRQFEYEN